MNSPENLAHTADKLYFSVIAHSPYPIRLDGWDVVVSEDGRSITIMDGPSRGRVIRYDEVGNYSKPQLKDYVVMFFIHGKWV